MERIAGFTGANVYKGSELYLSGDGQSIRQYIGGLAAGLRSNLQHTVPGQAGAVLAGMTLGGYDGISAQTREDFAAVGLAHLLAVSGTHIAVVTGFLLVLLRRRNHCTMALLAGILFLCGFVRVQTACTEGFAYVAGTIWSWR